MPSTRALRVRSHGGPDVLVVGTAELADPGPGQVAVQVEAAGVNFVDVYYREGVYPREPPFTLGEEGAGRVVELGPDVAGLEVGDVVAWASGSSGSMAGHALVDAERAVPVPDGLSAELAAAALLQGMTAQYLVSSTYPVTSGHAVLVHAAAGGVGQLLVQLAKARGAVVVATASTPEKAEVARGRGADHVLVYGRDPDAEELAAAVRDALGGHGVDVAYDGVGRATFEASLAALAPRGMLALFGASSGPVPPFDLQRLNPAGSLFVTRPSLKHYTADRDELRWRAGEVLAAVADRTLELEIGGRYRLDDAVGAFRDLESRATTGKLLVLP